MDPTGITLNTGMDYSDELAELARLRAENKRLRAAMMRVISGFDEGMRGIRPEDGWRVGDGFDCFAIPILCDALAEPKP